MRMYTDDTVTLRRLVDICRERPTSARSRVGTHNTILSPPTLIYARFEAPIDDGQFDSVNRHGKEEVSREAEPLSDSYSSSRRSCRRHADLCYRGRHRIVAGKGNATISAGWLARPENTPIETASTKAFHGQGNRESMASGA